MNNYNEFISSTNNLERINELRKRNEKRFFLARIAVELESLEKKFGREGKSESFLSKCESVNKKMKELAVRGNLSAREIKDYCLTYKIRLNYA